MFPGTIQVGGPPLFYSTSDDESTKIRHAVPKSLHLGNPPDLQTGDAFPGAHNRRGIPPDACQQKELQKFIEFANADLCRGGIP